MLLLQAVHSSIAPSAPTKLPPGRYFHGLTSIRVVPFSLICPICLSPVIEAEIVSPKTIYKSVKSPSLDLIGGSSHWHLKPCGHELTAGQIGTLTAAGLDTPSPTVSGNLPLPSPPVPTTATVKPTATQPVPDYSTKKRRIVKAIDAEEVS